MQAVAEVGVAQEPEGFAGQHGLDLGIEGELGFAGDGAIEGVEAGIVVLQAVGIAGRGIGGSDLAGIGAGGGLQLGDEGGAAAVDHGIREHGGDDFAAQPVLVDGVREGLVQALGEVAVELLAQIRVVGDGGIHQVGEERQLGVGEDHRQFGAGEAAAGGGAFAHCFVGGQELDGTIEEAPAFERVDEAQVVGEFGETAMFGDGEGEGLQVVVAQAQLGDGVGHRGEELVADLVGQLAAAGQGAERDLDIDLEIRGIDAGGVVDGVGVDAATLEGILDAAALGDAEISTFADHLGADVGTGDAERVVGLVAGLGVGFGGGAHIGADAAEPEQVDFGLQNGADHLVGGDRLVAEAEGAAGLGK